MGICQFFRVCRIMMGGSSNYDAVACGCALFASFRATVDGSAIFCGVYDG